MIDISAELIMLVMFGSLFVLLMSGLHVVFALGVVGVIVLLLAGGGKSLPIIVSNVWAAMNLYSLIAIPLFVYMAMILEKAGITDSLFKTIRLWFGPVNGGLAMGVVFISTIIAAMSGTSSTGIVTMGLLAFPIMLKFRYKETLAIGPIIAGGALGFLIPPSVLFIIYGVIAEVSIGRLFVGGLIPGLVLSLMYITYIAVRCYFRPELGPALPPEERVGWLDKFIAVRGLILPVLLVIGVLGSIFLGIACPTEAAAVGFAGSLLCAAVNRRLNWSIVEDASYRTLRISAMLLWVLAAAFIFKAAFIYLGGGDIVNRFITGLGLSPLMVIGLMQLSFMFLGCFLDESPIILLTIPVYLPIVTNLGFDPVWFGVLFMVNMQMANTTPPFGMGLFYFKGVAPGVNMATIYRSIVPFIGLQFIGVMLVLFFPQLALWLPDVIFKRS